MNWFFVLFLHLFLLTITSPVYGFIQLNEVIIKPTQIVEVINTSSESADISGWFIDDSGGSTYFTIPQNTYVYPFSCLIFSGDFNLNTSSPDTIRLFSSLYPPTSSSAVLVDSYSYTKAPEASYSFSRIPDGTDVWTIASNSAGLWNNTSSSCLVFPTVTPTPSQTPSTTSIPSPQPTPSYPTHAPLPQELIQNIYLSELYPYPYTNEQEWLELYNDNDVSVTLVDWYIDDSANSGSSKRIFSLSIPPKQYKTVSFATSLFNNEGDTVRLLDQSEEERESIDYVLSKKGLSLGRVQLESDRFCLQIPSPDSINNTCIEQTTTSPSKPSLPTHSQSAIPSIKPLFKGGTTSYSSVSYNHPPLENKSNILGISNLKKTSPRKTQRSFPYSSLFSLLSFEYSFLTGVSLFIKMKHVE